MLKTRLYNHLEHRYNFDIKLINTVGTSIIEDEGREPHGWIPIWKLEQHVFVRVHPVDAHHIYAALEDKPDNHQLTLQDVQMTWGEQIEGTSFNYYYVLDAERFKPVTPAERYTTRQLAKLDNETFAAFIGQSSKRDREVADVGLDDGIAYGVLDDERIVAAASTYELHGFTDIGVLTDPDYRQQGLGKAAVSALSEHFLDKPDLLLYRHETDNLGSMGIIRSLGYWHFADVDFVKFKRDGS